MYRFIQPAVLMFWSMLFVGIQNSTAQSMCKHLKQQHAYAAQPSYDQRADTFDVLHYTINASFLNYEVDQSIDALTILTVVKKKQAQQLRLNLLDLAVSSVEVNGSSVSFTQNLANLFINIQGISADTLELAIAYSGKPTRDAQWGGFYFNGPYAFNMGVGFASDPHNFGRVWFPCFDNFTDRATYSFNITVDTSKRAYCNGHRTGIDIVGAKATHRWVLSDPIPTYLVAVAIAPYEEVAYTVDDIPVLITALAGDTANARESFQNLDRCIRLFEDKYGDHSFERIGFNIVPFNAGAMEHATNIAYPRYAIANGSLNNETLFAHELAHHWWGNTTTCRTQEDMWLNEGWASYSEALFVEEVYGKAAYDEYIEENHRKVLQFSHIRDGESLPVSGIGHANTYGSHVYDKGGDMVHTLRGIMGDDDFFTACGSFQLKYKFQSVTTDSMENHFQQYTTQNLSGFFEQWIKTAGYAHFDIVEVSEYEDSGQLNYNVITKQTPRFNQEVYLGVPVTFTCLGEGFERYDTTLILNETLQSFNVSPGFAASSFVLDIDDRLSDAVNTATWLVDSVGSYDRSMDGLAVVDVQSMGRADSIFLRVEHHWSSADATYGLPEGVTISRNRYWNVTGIWPVDVSMKCTLTYSGIQSPSSLTYGFLDHDILRITEDSLVLLYRPNGTSKWVEYSDYSRAAGSVFDKRGEVILGQLRKGQYAFGMRDPALAHHHSMRPLLDYLKVYPNPSDDVLNIQLPDINDTTALEVTNTEGKVVLRVNIPPGQKKLKLNTSELDNGVYFIGQVYQTMAYDMVRFVVNH